MKTCLKILAGALMGIALGAATGLAAEAPNPGESPGLTQPAPHPTQPAGPLQPAAQRDTEVHNLAAVAANTSILENAVGELYLNDARQTLGRLVPWTMLDLIDPELAVARPFEQIDAKNIFAMFFESSGGIVVAAQLPSGGNLLKDLETSQISQADLFRAWGIPVENFPPAMQQEMAETLSQPTDAPGIQALGPSFLGVAGDMLVVGGEGGATAAARERLLHGAPLFPVPENQQIWGKFQVPVGEIMEQPNLPDCELRFAMKSFEGGWKYEFSSNASEIYKDLSGKAAFETLKTPVYGKGELDALYVSSGSKMLGQILADASDNPQQKLLAAILSEMESITISFGGDKINVMGLDIPNAALALTGNSQWLGQLVAIALRPIGNWEERNIQDWSKVMVCKDVAIHPMVSLPLTCAERTGEVLLSLSMDPLALAPQGSVGEVVSLMLAPYGVQPGAVPEEVSSIYALDVKKIWRDLGSLLDPNGFPRMLAASLLRPDELAVVDKLRYLTPPLQAMAGWTAAGDFTSSNGYILVDEQGAAEFSSTLRSLINILKNRQP